MVVQGNFRSLFPVFMNEIHGEMKFVFHVIIFKLFDE
jgi:hypothetical protein